MSRNYNPIIAPGGKRLTNMENYKLGLLLAFAKKLRNTRERFRRRRFIRE